MTLKAIKADDTRPAELNKKMCPPLYNSSFRSVQGKLGLSCGRKEVLHLLFKNIQ